MIAFKFSPSILETFIYQIDIFLYNMPKLIQISKHPMLKRRNFIHAPTLTTVLMVENILKKSGELISVAELKRRLPRKVMHQTLLKILDYLHYSGKIIIGTKGILWVFAERKELNDLIKKGTEL